MFQYSYGYKISDFIKLHREKNYSTAYVLELFSYVSTTLFTDLTSLYFLVEIKFRN